MNGADPVRVNYYDGETLLQSDFQVEQQYLVDALRLHNRYLHTWGIARGLDVTAGEAPREVVVGPGLAVDGSGREIVLTEARTVTLPEGAAACYVTIAFREVPCGLSAETMVAGPKYWCDDPDVAASVEAPACPPETLLLARVETGPGGAVARVDGRLRRHTGIDAGRVGFILPTVPADHWPALQAFVEAPRYGLAVDAPEARFDGTVTVEGNAGVGTARPAATLDVCYDAVAHDGLDFVAQFRAEVEGAAAVALVATPEGRVGIGTTAPPARLTVAGDVGIEDARALLFDGEGQLRSFDDEHYVRFRPAEVLAEGSLELREYGAVHFVSGFVAEAQPPAMLLEADGRVGVGTSILQADARLTVSGVVASTKGGLMFPDGTLQTTAAISTSVPVGAVIEWWRPSLDMPVPEGFVICSDGSIDAGITKPDLQDRLIRGTSSFAEIGQTGGATQHAHTISFPEHTHAIPHTHPNVSTTTGPASAWHKNEWDRGSEQSVSFSEHTHFIPSTPVGAQSTDESGKAGALTGASTQPHANDPSYVGLLMLYRYK